ncbi:apolipoprotein N-acyltransferase [Thermopolyspora sp. NPDC052614]|uniref:apolipoprotein N-acyltransferase n=1 Tax=Thermopolyspora sp. NPDC052614 TaxID=3155682 RepID=UPI003443409E
MANDTLQQTSGQVDAPAAAPTRAWKRLVTGIAGGLLLYLAFPPSGLWFLAPPGIMLLTLSLYGTRPRRAAWLGYVGAVAFLLPTLAWVRPIGDDAWLALVGLEALFWALLGAGAAVVMRLPGWSLWVACLWVAQEWLRGTVPAGGFPWARVAFSQADSPFVGFAALGGVPLVSFLVVLCGTLLAAAIVRIARPRDPNPFRINPFGPGGPLRLGTRPWARNRSAAPGAGNADGGDTGGAVGAPDATAARSGEPGDDPTPDPAGGTGLGPAADSPAPAPEAALNAVSVREPGTVPAGEAPSPPTAARRPRAVTRPIAGTLAGTIAGVVAIPLLGLAVPRPAEEGARTVRVGIVQGNVPGRGINFLGDEPAVVLRNHANVTHEMARAVREGRLPKPDLVAWPENSTDIDPYRSAFARDTIQAAARDIGVPVLVGAVVRTPDGKNRYTRSLVWDPVTGAGDYYDKQKLVLFGEYIPFRDVLQRFIGRLRLAGVSALPGTKDGDLVMGPVTIGAINCYEVAYDSVVRGTVRAGGTPLIVQTNNATYALTGLPAQQLAMSRLRAVEHDRAVIAAATTGISAYIDPDGRVRWQTRELVADSTVVEVPVRTGETIATRVGALPEWMLILVGTGVLGAALLGGRRASRARREDAMTGDRRDEAGTTRPVRSTRIGAEDR